MTGKPVQVRFKILFEEHAIKLLYPWNVYIFLFQKLCRCQHKCRGILMEETFVGFYVFAKVCSSEKVCWKDLQPRTF